MRQIRAGMIEVHNVQDRFITFSHVSINVMNLKD